LLLGGRAYDENNFQRVLTRFAVLGINQSPDEMGGQPCFLQRESLVFARSFQV